MGTAVAVGVSVLGLGEGVDVGSGVGLAPEQAVIRIATTSTQRKAQSFIRTTSAPIIRSHQPRTFLNSTNRSMATSPSDESNQS